MADYRITWGFVQGKQGWSETLVYTTGQQDFMQVMLYAQQIAQLRAQLLGAQASVNVIRVSAMAPNKGSLVREVDYPGPPEWPCAAPGVALKVMLYDALFQRSKPIYARGIWDEIEVNGGKITTAPVGFIAAYNNWLAPLINGSFGWVGALNSESVALKGYTSNPNDVVTIETLTDLFPPALAGKKVKVRISGVNRQSDLNGVQIVRVIDSKHGEVVKPIALFPYKSGGQAKLVGPVIIQARNQVPQKITTRRLGAPLLRTLGRQQASARG